MKLRTAIPLLLLGVTILVAAKVDETLKAARRMCANDSIPQALMMLEEQLKAKLSRADEFLLYLEKGDILLYYARLPREASKVYEGLINANPLKERLGELYYRLGLALERSESFIEAARAYEKVVTEHQDSFFYNYALAAIERCFVKNYEIKVAEVDSYPISELDYNEIVDKLSPSERDSASTPQGRNALIDRIIYERLLKLAAAEEFAPVDSTEIELRLSCHSCRPKKVVIPGKLNDPQLEQRIRTSTSEILLRALYNKEVLDRVSVTEKEKKRYYKEHPDRFTVPAKYTLRELVTDSARIDSVQAAIKQGMPFDSTVMLYSTAPSKNRGGLLSERLLSSLPTQMQEVVKNLKVGDTSQPYFTDRGWEIVLLEAKTDAQKTPYEQVALNIKDMIEQERIGQLSEEALVRFRKDAQVDTISAGDTLARVAGAPILPSDLDTYIKTIPFLRPGQAEDTLFRKGVLDQMVAERVFDHELAQQKLFIADSLSNLVESRRTQLLVDASLMKVLEPQAQVSDEEVKAYYDSHKKEFWHPAEAKVREILVASPDTARMIYELAKSSTPFDSLAKAYSKAETGPRGGYVGYIKQAQSGKPYERQAFSLKEGSVSKPVKTPEGYWLIQMERKQEAYQQTYENSISEIRSKLYMEKKKAAEDALRKQLMASVQITIYEQSPVEEEKSEEETPTTKD